jgi:glycosyltransferase involved in cell wall biosynthesis
MKTFAVALMVKNEQTYLIKSLNSVKEHVDTIVIFDTGSTDRTIDELEEWCEENDKKLCLKRGKFVDFATSRNELLEFAQETAPEPYLLLLDANDEARGDWKELEAAAASHVHGATIEQEWHSDENIVSFLNIRFIINGPKLPKIWSYVGVVHEYLSCSVCEPVITEIKGFKIYQDRENDGGKSSARLKSDYKLLLEQVAVVPDDARSWFYLARTCDSLGKYHESLVYYARRLEIRDAYVEEEFWSRMGMARCYSTLGHKHLAVHQYSLAFEIEQRAEPLVELAEWHIREKMLQIAYLLVKRACDLCLPSNASLFVDKKTYEYKRWHLMGIVAFYCGTNEEGRDACERALAVFENNIDRENLKHYITPLEK